VPGPSAGDFRVLAIGASSPGNAWLLGQLATMRLLAVISSRPEFVPPWPPARPWDSTCWARPLSELAGSGLRPRPPPPMSGERAGSGR